MKKLFTLLAASVSLAVFAPAESQAFDGHNHGSSRSYANRCGSCGTAVYRQRVVIGRDRHGCAIYGYRTVSHNCRPSYRGHGHDHGRHSGHSSSSGSRFGFGGRSGHR